MPDDTLSNQLARDLAAIPQLSTAALRDIMACRWDVFRALTRYAQRIEVALEDRLQAYGAEPHHDDIA